jgi:hypothetical protein
MKRTYIDANILIAAFQGEEPVALRALQVLDDPERNLVVSDFLRLEVLPKPVFHKRFEEVEFMNAIFEKVAENVATNPELTGKAVEIAGQYNLSPVDSLHISAAMIAKVDEFITMEKPTKPMFRITDLKVVSMHSESETNR